MKVDLTNEQNKVLTGKDGIVIRQHISGFEGGRVLVVEGYPADVIPAGVPVITDGNGVYKPLLPTDTTVESETTYGFTIPNGYSVCGIVEATIRTKMPTAAILTAGVVNEVAMIDSIKQIAPPTQEEPNDLSLSAIKSALPLIQFVKDEVA